jgi:hypothetical protein
LDLHRGELARITAKAPGASILLVGGPPGTVQNYGAIAAHLPTPKAAKTGSGPCDMFSLAGNRPGALALSS